MLRRDLLKSLAAAMPAGILLPSLMTPTSRATPPLRLPTLPPPEPTTNPKGSDVTETKTTTPMPQSKSPSPGLSTEPLVSDPMNPDPEAEIWPRWDLLPESSKTLLSPTTETTSPPDVAPGSAEQYPIDWGDWLPVTGVENLFERYGSAINPRTSPHGRVGHEYVWQPAVGFLSVSILTTFASRYERQHSVLRISGLVPQEFWHDRHGSWFDLAMSRAHSLRHRLTTLNNMRPLQGLNMMPWSTVDELVWRNLPKPSRADAELRSGWHRVLSAALPGIYTLGYGSRVSVERMVRLVASDCEIAGPGLINHLPLNCRSIVKKKYEKLLADRKAVGS